MLKEFKEFAMRGNVVDLAIGVIIGGAFGTIVSSFVKDILTPPLGLLTGGLDFSSWKIPLSAISENATSLNIGLFINAVINFTIVAFALFLVVRQINKIKGPAPAPPAPTTRECPFCISAIPKAAKRCPHCTAEVSPVLV